jgi:hypothetical protein
LVPGTSFGGRVNFWDQIFNFRHALFEMCASRDDVDYVDDDTHRAWNGSRSFQQADIKIQQSTMFVSYNIRRNKALEKGTVGLGPFSILVQFFSHHVDTPTAANI